MLPEIDEGSYTVASIEVLIPLPMQSFVTFDQGERKFQVSSRSKDGIFTASITLYYSDDQKVAYYQTVVIKNVQSEGSDQEEENDSEEPDQDLFQEEDDMDDNATGSADSASSQSSSSTTVKGKTLEIPAEVSIPGAPHLKVPPLKEEQKELLTTPVEDIPEEKLFAPIPLVARLTTGVPNVKDLVLRQR